MAAERRGCLGPTLRFIREVLGVEDATDLIERPAARVDALAVLAARHAYLRRVGAPRRATRDAGAPPAAPRRPLRHARDPRGLRRACGGDAGDVAALVAAFRRGGRRAAADGDAR